MMSDPTRKISRPRQLYVGKPIRKYVPLAEREVTGKRMFKKVEKAASVMQLPIL